MRAFLVLLFFVSLPATLAPERNCEMIVWNVGQGQFVTFVNSQGCTHFDMGGEKLNWNALARVCGQWPNRVYFSHWDLDHISLARRALKVLPQLCIAKDPQGPNTNANKAAMLASIPHCPQLATANELHFETHLKTGANHWSRVFTQNDVLIPGDSTVDEEKSWTLRLGPEIHILVLGHHGSQTSTSELLLSRLTELRFAIASARKRRYGHPHWSVVARLKEHFVSVVSTEIWGDLHLRLN